MHQSCRNAQAAPGLGSYLGGIASRWSQESKRFRIGQSMEGTVTS